MMLMTGPEAVAASIGICVLIELAKKAMLYFGRILVRTRGHIT